MSTSLAGKAKACMVHSASGWTCGVQVKLWDPLRTRAIPERLRGVFTTRRYINTRLPLPYLYLTYTSSTSEMFLANDDVMQLHGREELTWRDDDDGDEHETEDAENNEYWDDDAPPVLAVTIVARQLLSPPQYHSKYNSNKFSNVTDDQKHVRRFHCAQFAVCFYGKMSSLSATKTVDETRKTSSSRIVLQPQRRNSCFFSK